MSFDQHVRLSIEHAVALPDRREPEGLHEMTLAGAGGAQQQDVLALADKARRGEFEDQRAWDLGVEAEVEAVEGAVRIPEASGLDASREEPILASDELIADQGRHRVDRYLTLALGFKEAGLERVGHAREAQLAQGVVEFGHMHTGSPSARRSMRSR